MHPTSFDADTGTVTPEARKLVLERLQASYPPELLNRLDDQLVFNHLGPSSIASIVDIRLRELQSMLDDRRITLIVGKKAKAWIAEKGYDAVYGARALNRLITKQLRSPISAALLKGTIRPGDKAEFVVEEGDLKLIELHEAETSKVVHELEVLDDEED